MTIQSWRNGFSLLELMAVVAVLGLVAAVIVPRVIGGDGSAKIGRLLRIQG